MNEHKSAFPYAPPTSEIKLRYNYIFEINKPLPPRFVKVLFDKIFALLVLLFSIPSLIIIKIFYIIEGFLIPENAGKMLFYYYAVSGGKVFRKYKLRIIKNKFIDNDKATCHEWEAYSAEWTPESRTYLGIIIKKFYLDEIPQFWSVLKGEMSIVGPRPLAVIHYERDLKQGNVCRQILTGGLLGLGHINKGTDEMGNPIFEYEYVDQYIKNSSLKLLILDLWIIWKGILVILKGGGH